MKRNRGGFLKFLPQLSHLLLLVGMLAGPEVFAQDPALDVSKTIVLRLDFNIAYEDLGSYAELTVLIPNDYLGRQKILAENYSIEPTGIYDDSGRRYAYFDLAQLGHPESIVMDFDIELTGKDLSILKTMQRQVPTANTMELSSYLEEERYFETDDEELIEVAKHFVDVDPLQTVLNIQDFVATTLSYTGYSAEDKGASIAFREHAGDCTEFTDLFVTLCRIDGIPARIVDGYVLENLSVGHAWVEVYLNDFGWIPFDPVWYAQDDQTTFEVLRNMYVYLSTERTDMNLDGYHYYSYKYNGTPISVDQTMTYRLRQ